MNEDKNEAGREAAERFKKEHKILDRSEYPTGGNDHYLLEIVRELQKNGQLLADDKNQAFSQLNMGGKLKQMFESVDETKEFALGFTYARHAFDDIENDLIAMGVFNNSDDETIFSKIQEAKDLEEVRTILTDSTIDLKAHIVEEFQNRWMQSRVPADRKRVEEYIRLNQAVREIVQQHLGEAAIPKEPGAEKRRLF
jgi:hypothetical protein